MRIELPRENPSQSHFVHHRSIWSDLGIETWPQYLDASDWLPELRLGLCLWCKLGPPWVYSASNRNEYQKRTNKVSGE
jgi:hypothetical protein